MPTAFGHAWCRLLIGFLRIRFYCENDDRRTRGFRGVRAVESNSPPISFQTTDAYSPQFPCSQQKAFSTWLLLCWQPS